MGGFDPREWAGVTVATHGGNNIVIPSGATVFLDAITFLNGRGARSTATLQALLTAAGTGAGVWTFGLNSSDRFYIENSADDFTVGTAGTAYGFSASGHGLVGGSAPFRRTATADWTRGMLAASTHFLTITPASSAAFTFPSATQRLSYTNPVIQAVAMGSDPYDGTEGTPASQCLTAIHATAVSSAHVHWALDSDGHVVATWAGSLGAVFAFSSTSFARRLGFSGTYTITGSAGTVYTMRAPYPMPGVLVPTRPLEDLRNIPGEDSARVRLTTGNTTANLLARWVSHETTVLLDGPLSSANHHGHYTVKCRKLWSQGCAFTLYRDWGDTRYGVAPIDNDAAYDLYRTIQRDGLLYGRVRGTLANPPPEVAWNAGSYLTAPLTLRIDEDAI